MKNRIKELREQRGLTQEQLGELVGVSRQAINAIETENGVALAANQVGILKRFPKRFVKTIRPQKVTIQALNEYGEEIIVDGEKEFYEQGYYDVRRMWFWKDYLRQEKRTGRIYPTFH